MSNAETRFGGEEAGVATFADATFVVLPAPLEATVSYGTGTGAGPGAIIAASDHLEFLDEQTTEPYWLNGEVHTLPPLSLPADPAAAVDAIAAAAGPVVEAGKFLITLGGEHTVTAGPVRPVVKRWDDLGLLVIDAHFDLRDEFHGTPWSHACVMRRIREEHGLPITFCGVRALGPDDRPFLSRADIHPFWAHDADPEGAWIARAVDTLPDHVYISLDVDALDPSEMPGTGAPEPGGLSYRQVIGLLEEVTSRRNVVALDCVEVAPIPGQQVSEFTAARMVAKTIGLIRNRE